MLTPSPTYTVPMRSFLVLTLLVAYGAWKSDARVTVRSPYCGPAGTEANLLIEQLRLWSNATDQDAVRLRTALQLSPIDPADVQLVEDEALCQRAVDSLNALAVRHGGQPLYTRPYLIRFGSSHYMAYEPPPPSVPPTRAPSMMHLLDANFSPKRAVAQ